MNKELALDVIGRTGGKIFSATFVKKNGDVREMTCRLDVKKGVNGKGLSFKPSEHDLLCVFDMKNNGFRMINLNTLQQVKVGGKIYR